MNIETYLLIGLFFVELAYIGATLNRIACSIERLTRMTLCKGR